jgi:antitoxin VapB
MMEGKMSYGARAKVFMNGRSQAIRLPKEFRVDTKEVLLTKEAGKIIITPQTSWKDFFEVYEPIPEYSVERDMSLPQERDVFE